MRGIQSVYFTEGDSFTRCTLTYLLWVWCWPGYITQVLNEISYNFMSASQIPEQTLLSSGFRFSSVTFVILASTGINSLIFKL